ncbi:phosphatidylserine decarboxylase [Malaciobacter marinus]|uniref:phosphatidylserine decarboxylase n=1 Tax=Malaciobacter marinus TaxID=505249 RepID=UPI003B00F691
MLDKYILKQGQKISLYLLVFAVFLQVVDLEFLSIITFFLFFLCLYVYRVKKIIIDNEAFIVSAISGKVEAIDFNDNYYLIYLNASLFDNSVLLSPEDSFVKIETLKKGLFLPFDEKKAKLLNEKIVLSTKNTIMELVSSFATAPLDKPIEKEYKKGDQLGVFTQGELLLKIEKSFSLNIKVGQTIQAGQTICY